MGLQRKNWRVLPRPLLAWAAESELGEPWRSRSSSWDDAVLMHRRGIRLLDGRHRLDIESTGVPRRGDRWPEPSILVQRQVFCWSAPPPWVSERYMQRSTRQVQYYYGWRNVVCVWWQPNSPRRPPRDWFFNMIEKDGGNSIFCENQ